jgi:branched-chain amino acid transport system ATP-binding protein
MRRFRGFIWERKRIVLLEIENIDTYYETTHILFGATLEVHQSETVCVLGRNGVGKTTLMRSIIGLTPPRRGSIYFQEAKINGKQPFQIARLGVGFVPENRDIFPNLTVQENLEIAAIKKRKAGAWNQEKVYALFPVLKQREKQWGGTLSGGEQQMLTIARTLMGNPILLLLDEPSEGLAPLVVEVIKEQILQIQEEGMTIFLSEQNSVTALEVSQRAYILEKGQVSWQGPISELSANPQIMEQYLGV